MLNEKKDVPSVHIHKHMQAHATNPVQQKHRSQFGWLRLSVRRVCDVVSIDDELSFGDTLKSVFNI